MSPHSTSPTPSTRSPSGQQGRLLPLARALLLVACTQAPLLGTAWAQSADAVLLTDAFTQAADWIVNAEGQAARFADGRVTLPALKDGNSAVVALSRELKLAPGSAWTASVRITTAANAGADGAAGLTFVGANDTQVVVMVRPQERDVVVIYRDGSTDRWQTPLLGFTASPALRGHGQPNVLNVSSRNGRLYIDVNDQAVGATRSLDFAPSAIGLRNTTTGATYEALKVQAAGQDSRLARLLGLVPTPGARVLFTDSPSTAASTGRALFSSATGFLKGLTGSGDKASSEPDKPPSPESAWSDDAKDGSYRRDKRRGVVVLSGDDEDAVAWAGPTMLAVLPGAPGYVQATVTLLGEAQEDDGPGIYLQPSVHPRDKDQDQSNRNTLFAKINANNLEVLLRDRTTKKWKTLDDVELPNRDPKAPATLRLVLSGTRAIVFLDGRWLTAVDLPYAFDLDRAGVRAEGLTKAEFSGFTVAEL